MLWFLLEVQQSFSIRSVEWKQETLDLAYLLPKYENLDAPTATKNHQILEDTKLIILHSLRSYMSFAVFFLCSYFALCRHSDCTNKLQKTKITLTLSIIFLVLGPKLSTTISWLLDFLTFLRLFNSNMFDFWTSWLFTSWFLYLYMN